MRVAKYFILIFVILVQESSFSCTSFARLDEGFFLMAKSYDFTQGHGLLIVNKKGVAKRSMEITEYAKVSWVSKYGSVTFNQQGRELPSGGINEAGLAVELMWLEDGEFPKIMKGEKAINELQWIQYQLDNFKNVKEVISNYSKLPIITVVAPLHYLICDSSESCAVIDFDNGSVKIYTDKDLEFRVLTNHRYSYLLKKFHKSSQQTSKSIGEDSVARFIRIANLLKSTSATVSPIDNAFTMLKEVTVTTNSIGKSQWNIVYDLKTKQLWFKTRAASKLKTLQLGKLDFTCKSKVKIFDLNSQEEAGNIIPFLKDYKISDNERIVKESQKFLRTQLPDEVVNSMERATIYYPETTECKEI